MAERVLKGGICHSFYQYAKANNKCMKDQVLKSDLPVHKYIQFRLNNSLRRVSQV